MSVTTRLAKTLLLETVVSLGFGVGMAQGQNQPQTKQAAPVERKAPAAQPQLTPMQQYEQDMAAYKNDIEESILNPETIAAKTKSREFTAALAEGRARPQIAQVEYRPAADVKTPAAIAQHYHAKIADAAKYLSEIADKIDRPLTGLADQGRASTYNQNDKEAGHLVGAAITADAVFGDTLDKLLAGIKIHMDQTGLSATPVPVRGGLTEFLDSNKQYPAYAADRLRFDAKEMRLAAKALSNVLGQSKLSPPAVEDIARRAVGAKSIVDGTFQQYTNFVENNTHWPPMPVKPTGQQHAPAKAGLTAQPRPGAAPMQTVSF